MIISLSLPFSIEIPTPTCHPSHPKASQSYTVSLPSGYRRVYFTQVAVVSVKEPPCEDTKRELKERVYRSGLVAVDIEQIKREFSAVRVHRIGLIQIPGLNANVRPFQVCDRKPLRLVPTSSRSQTTASPLLLFEIPLAAPPSSPWVNPRLNVPPKTSPHKLPTKGICCPVVLVDPSRQLRSQEKKGKRRRRKPENKNKLVP